MPFQVVVNGYVAVTGVLVAPERKAALLRGVTKALNLLSQGHDVPAERTVAFHKALYARAVAKPLGTDQHKMLVTAEDALAVMPSLPAMYNEPIADNGQSPTHLHSAPTSTRGQVQFTGADISQALIDQLRRREAQIPLRLFGPVHRGRRMAGPRSPVPAAVWPHPAGIRELHPLDHSIRTADHASRRMLTNLDVSASGLRCLNLECAINLPPAERYLTDYRISRNFPRYLGLWRRETIAAAVQRWQ